MITQPINATNSIKTLAFQQTPITLTASYKGLLFDERINPLKVGLDQITFSLPRQHVVLILCDPLILHSRALPESVRANMSSIDLSVGEMALTNFRFSGVPWRDRYEQRVQPVLPLNAMLTIDNRIINASLIDLSLHGAGVLIEGEQGQMPDPQIKSSIDINFQLDRLTRLSMRCGVSHVRRGGSNLLSLGLRLFPTSYQESLLEPYITKRKLEIMYELQELVREKMQTIRLAGRITFR